MGPVLDVVLGGTAGGADPQAPIPYQAEWVRRTYFPTTVSGPAVGMRSGCAHTRPHELPQLDERPYAGPPGPPPAHPTLMAPAV